VFDREPTIIKHPDEPNNLEVLLDRMLEIRIGGATNIKKALQSGHTLLMESKSSLKTGILVTDGWVTTGGDPLEITAKYQRLHVLGITFGLGGSDPETNSRMAKRGRGKYTHVRNFDDLLLAISKILARN
jgi:Mg-chelatase subunit ChlD